MHRRVLLVSVVEINESLLASKTRQLTWDSSDGFSFC